jgi:hypothetical protein
MLSAIVYALRDKPVDAVLFLDRLDSYRVDASDVQARRGPRARQTCFRAEASARCVSRVARARGRACWAGAGDSTGVWQGWLKHRGSAAW